MCSVFYKRVEFAQHVNECCVLEEVLLVLLFCKGSACKQKV